MMRAAVFSGADCVYVGVRGFNARSTAANFGADELAEAVAFCHARNCEVYAAVNTLVFPGGEQEMYKAVQAVAQAGCDAVIVQDLAAAKAVRTMAKSLPLHASTQMSVHSLAGVYQLAELGFTRAILARELSEREIAAIAEKSPIELEVFVHGALCVCVSGQCYASAFLGGRSANRGGCAGPCRLPFVQAGEQAAKHANTADGYALSLKDLSILKALPRLEAMGVKSAKIEGRLRGPEYCAVAVDSAIKAREGKAYDSELLERIFSRSGFTDGWFTAKGAADMFGVRSDDALSETKRAMPQARELYRRERPRVAVDGKLQLCAQGASLLVQDGTHTVSCELKKPLEEARQSAEGTLLQALCKTGGTPFYFEPQPSIEAGGYFLASGEAAQLRKDALHQLLQLRQTVVPHSVTAPPSARAERQTTKDYHKPPKLWARFEQLAQLPKQPLHYCEKIIVPLEQAMQLPPQLRPHTYLSLPRVLFGEREALAVQQVQQTSQLGFAGYEVNNLAHLTLCKGLPMVAGFGMNLTNAAALGCMESLGCVAATLSVELSIPQMHSLNAGRQDNMQSGAICYGHIPLMITRACPKKGKGCATCAKQEILIDRKAAALQVRCDGSMRTIYNPVALWMGDKLGELPCDYALAYFTTEGAEQVEDILHRLPQSAPAPQSFTRGLYYKGTNQGNVNTGAE